jgi:hypothetical protein
MAATTFTTAITGGTGVFEGSAGTSATSGWRRGVRPDLPSAGTLSLIRCWPAVDARRPDPASVQREEAPRNCRGLLVGHAAMESAGKAVRRWCRRGTADGADRPADSGRRRPTTASRPGWAPWWSSRSGSWPTRGRCGAGVACCAGSGTSTGPPRRASASADGSTASRHERSIRTPSMTNWSTML